MCFTIKRTGFVGKLRLRSHDHAQKELRFLGLLDAAANRVLEVFFEIAWFASQ